jgi:hypothetical protein
MDLAGGAASQHNIQCDEREGVRILEGSLDASQHNNIQCDEREGVRILEGSLEMTSPLPQVTVK